MALIVCLWCSANSQIAVGQQVQSISNAKLSRFLTLAEELRVLLNVPGAGIGIVENNEVIYAGGVGFRNIKEEKPVTADTLFAIGSNTKAFTGLLVSKLVSEKKLDWDKPISNFIPDFKLSDPYVTKHMTLADACSHMTGIARRDELWKGRPLNRQQIFEQVAELPFNFSLRKQFSYNNHMYVVVGKAIEHASGDTWENNVRGKIFEPLNMSQSFTTYDDFVKHDERSTGYEANGQTTIPHLNIDNVAPAGAISSTPRDYAKWLKLWVNKGTLDGEFFISRDQYDNLATPRSATMIAPNEFKSYWAGWSERIYRGEVQLIHSGGIDGQNAYIFVRPSKGFGIFVMTNQISDYKGLLAKYAEQIFVDDSFERDKSEEERLRNASALGVFQASLLTEGIEAALKIYEDIPTKNFENAMNDLGYGLIASNELDKAKFVFELNCRDNPRSSNVWDSLGECFFLMKEYEASIENYRKSVELDDANDHAKQTILKLEKLLGR